jgi:cell division protein FtsB
VGLRTVEDLASLNDEGLRKIGMGAVELRQKAKAWMAAAQDKGKLTQDMTALQRTNEQLHNTVASLTAKMEALQAEMKSTKKTKGRKRAEDAESDISASDLIDE